MTLFIETTASVMAVQIPISILIAIREMMATQILIVIPILDSIPISISIPVTILFHITTPILLNPYSLTHPLIHQTIRNLPHPQFPS